MAEEDKKYAYRSLVRSPNGYMKVALIDELTGGIIPPDMWDNYIIRGVDTPDSITDTKADEERDPTEEDTDFKSPEEITGEYINSSADTSERGGPEGLTANIDPTTGAATSYSDPITGEKVIDNVPMGNELGYKVANFLGERVAGSKIGKGLNSLGKGIGKVTNQEVTPFEYNRDLAEQQAAARAAARNNEEQVQEDTTPTSPEQTSEMALQSTEMSNVAQGIAEEGAVTQGPSQELEHLATPQEQAAIAAAKSQGFGSLAEQSVSQTAAQNAQSAANPGFGVGVGASPAMAAEATVSNVNTSTPSGKSQSKMSGNPNEGLGITGTPTSGVNVGQVGGMVDAVTPNGQPGKRGGFGSAVTSVDGRGSVVDVDMRSADPVGLAQALGEKALGFNDPGRTSANASAGIGFGREGHYGTNESTSGLGVGTNQGSSSGTGNYGGGVSNETAVEAYTEYGESRYGGGSTTSSNNSGYGTDPGGEFGNTDTESNYGDSKSDSNNNSNSTSGRDWGGYGDFSGGVDTIGGGSNTGSEASSTAGGGKSSAESAAEAGYGSDPEGEFGGSNNGDYF